MVRSSTFSALKVTVMIEKEGAFASIIFSSSRPSKQPIQLIPAMRFRRLLNLSMKFVCHANRLQKVLERTMESVFRQSYPNIEYIIIDGASKDATVDNTASVPSSGDGQ
mgnify:CR=1 FL=1